MDVSSSESFGEQLPPGSIIADRYVVEKTLGIGGMGTVYAASDQMLGIERLALKVLHSDFADDQRATQRFLREVQLTRKLNHRNVVRTFDVGVDGAYFYFTMEYVEGRPLDQILESSKFPLEKIPKFIIELCSGLQEIHDAGIIHRDLKPANIIITNAGEVKIADFGIARQEFSELTAHNEIIGSTMYMAPEVWLGQKQTHSIDLYSIGVVLYLVITGGFPFPREAPAEMMRYHLERMPMSPKEKRPETPTWLNRLVMQLLAKTPQERPLSAEEILDYVRFHARVDCAVPVVDDATPELEEVIYLSPDLLIEEGETAESQQATIAVSEPAVFRRGGGQEQETLHGHKENLVSLVAMIRALCWTTIAFSAGLISERILLPLLGFVPRWGILVVESCILLLVAATPVALGLGLFCSHQRTRKAWRVALTYALSGAVLICGLNIGLLCGANALSKESLVLAILQAPVIFQRMIYGYSAHADLIHAPWGLMLQPYTGKAGPEFVLPWLAIPMLHWATMAILFLRPLRERYGNSVPCGFVVFASLLFLYGASRGPLVDLANSFGGFFWCVPLALWGIIFFSASILGQVNARYARR